MKKLTAALVAASLTILATLALGYPTIGARVVTLSSDPDVKEISFSIRNQTRYQVNGYCYTIHLFDLPGREILSRGEPFIGCRDSSLAPGEISRERVRVVSPGRAVRAEVDVMLTAPEGESSVFIL